MNPSIENRFLAPDFNTDGQEWQKFLDDPEKRRALEGVFEKAHPFVRELDEAVASGRVTDCDDLSLTQQAECYWRWAAQAEPWLESEDPAEVLHGRRLVLLNTARSLEFHIKLLREAESVYKRVLLWALEAGDDDAAVQAAAGVIRCTRRGGFDLTEGTSGEVLAGLVDGPGACRPRNCPNKGMCERCRRLVQSLRDEIDHLEKERRGRGTETEADEGSSDPSTDSEDARET